MADDAKPTETPTPADATEKPKVIPLEKFKELEERYANLEATIKALDTNLTNTRNQQSHQQTVSPGTLDRVGLIAQRLNADANQIRQWDPFLATYFEELAKPAMGAMAQLADKLDRMEARLEIPDYAKFNDDIEKERSTRLQRGEYLAPREAYHLVRSRKLPEILEAERARAAEEYAAKSASASQAGDTLSTTEKAGPSAVKLPAQLTKDMFEKLSPEDKERALENVTF